MASTTHKKESHLVIPSCAKPSPPRTDVAVDKALELLRPIIDALPDDEKSIATPLVLDCARLAVTMDVCWAMVARDGPVTSYDNGSGQSGTHENPAFGSYVKASRNLSSNIGKLIQIVGPGTCAADNLTIFLDGKRERS